MRFTVFCLLFISLLIGVSAQTRQEAIEKLGDLKNQAETLEKAILAPDQKDIEAAAQENFGVFRLLPREIYDKGFFAIPGGGAYYSFSNKSHNYGEIAQIELQREKIMVGFAGANYGFITDLGEIALSEINEKSNAVNFLANYQPPNQLPKARIEQQKARGFEKDGKTYKDNLPAVVGHSYALRAISFDRADVLVAFKIHRKDADGSLIIFWKLLKEFEKPMLERNY